MKDTKNMLKKLVLMSLPKEQLKSLLQEKARKVNQQKQK